MWLVVLDEQDYVLRENEALNISIRVTICLLAPNKPIPQQDPTSLGKLATEGCLEETKLILGRVVDIRRHTVLLVKEKLKMWTEEIHTIIGTA